MSGPQGKPFKARLGLDANNEKVINVKDPTDLTDAVNLQYFIASNTVQSFDATRTYPAGFVVERGDRIYKAKSNLSAGVWNGDQWTEIHAFDLWQRITGNYTAEPGDALVVNTQSASITITLPATAEEGDAITIVDDGYAATNPIVLNAQSNTFNGGAATTYSINSSDTLQVLFLGGTWRVNRLVEETYQYLTANATVTPNSWNAVSTSAARTITLPVAPIQGQWVVIADASMNARTNAITVQGNGKNIQGSGFSSSASYTIARFGEVATFVYDSTTGTWIVSSAGLSKRIPESTSPRISEQVFVTLDGTAKTMTLPTSQLATGDWVEVITKYQDETATGSLVVSAGGANYFRANGGTQNTTTFRIRNRGRFLFLYKASEWTVISLSDVSAVPDMSSGSMIANTTVKLIGTGANTITLPQSDQVQIGDIVHALVNTSGGALVVSVQNTSTDLINNQSSSLTTYTFTAAATNSVVNFIYRGWNGTNYMWDMLDEGAGYLRKTGNLSELGNVATARTNLSVYSKAESDANYLPLHGKADTAGQADNANLLDNLDSTAFIQVQNPTTTAYDANTTTETRFTTNVNTPDSNMWQVVTFVDSATGSKAQIAMTTQAGSSKISHRTYTSGAWNAWTALDQSGNAATATKLVTARTISLTGNASGSASFDGSANASITVSGVLADRSSPVATTTGTGGTYVDQYTKVATVTLTAQYGDYNSVWTANNYASANATANMSKLFVRIKQQAAFGSNPLIQMIQVVETDYDANEFYYVIVQNTPTTVVDIYARNRTSNNTIVISEHVRSSQTSNTVWYTGQAYVASVAGAVQVTKRKMFTDDYHPLADKWTTARTITLSGSGVSGSASLDGSADITIPVTITSTSIGNIPISQVTGLQAALDGKLSTTGKAADSDLLDGLDSTAFRLVSAPTQSGVDPNTVTSDIILTNHANTPDAGTSYWFIDTVFYQTASTSSNRFQFAYQYNGSQNVYYRQYYGSWSAWAQVAAIVAGNTYDINIARNAATATKLQTARAINGVSFDGTGNITVADSTKLPLLGGTMTGPIVRKTSTTMRLYDNVLNAYNGSTTVTGTIKIVLPVSWNNSMMKFKVVINDFTGSNRQGIELTVGGNNSTTGPTWNNVFANSDGNAATATGTTVRFGHDGTYNCVLIGTTASVWNYPYVIIKDVEIGYTGANDGVWDTGSWGVSYITSETGITVTGTATIDPIFARQDRTANFAGEVQSTNQNSMRIVSGNYGVFWRNDGSDYYLMATASGSQYGSYNSLRPFSFNLASGNVTIGQQVTITGGDLYIQNGATERHIWLGNSGGYIYGNSTAMGFYKASGASVSVNMSTGDFTTNGNVTAYSDRSLKTDIRVIENPVEKIKQLYGVTFRRLDFETEVRQTGLIAQDVQKVMPEAVTTTESGILSVAYGNLVGLLVEGIKEMDARMQAQDERIAKLESALEKLLGSV